jgi:hypothetical protein
VRNSRWPVECYVPRAAFGAIQVPNGASPPEENRTIELHIDHKSDHGPAKTVDLQTWFQWSNKQNTLKSHEQYMNSGSIGEHSSYLTAVHSFLDEHMLDESSHWTVYTYGVNREAFEKVKESFDDYLSDKDGETIAELWDWHTSADTHQVNHRVDDLMPSGRVALHHVLGQQYPPGSLAHRYWSSRGDRELAAELSCAVGRGEDRSGEGGN